MSFAALRNMVEHRPEWKPSRLKFALLRNDGGVWGEDFDEEGMVVLRSTEVAVDGEWRISDPAKRRLSARDQRAGLLLEGDLLVTKSSGSENHLGKTALVSKEVASLQAAFSNFMQRLRVRQKHNPRYYYYLLNSYVGREYLCCLGSTTTGLRNLSGGVLAELVISGPSLSEQTQIAKFLDYETLRIDALIKKQQQLIALLKEKRQSVISHAVTKGLNPDAPMRDSGVEWLGEVPAHWEIKQFRHLSPVRRGASPRPIDDPKYFDDDGEYAWTRIADVTASKTFLESSQQRLSKLGSSLSVKLEPGSLFLSIAGTVGKPCIAGIKACIHDGFVYFPGLKISNMFLFYIFAGGQAYKGLGKMGTQLNLNTDTVGGIKIAVPPPQEIETIVVHLDQMTSRFDRLIYKQEAFGELLQERRTALISAAVTGKIDVRGWKAPESETKMEVTS